MNKFFESVMLRKEAASAFPQQDKSPGVATRAVLGTVGGLAGGLAGLAFRHKVLLKNKNVQKALARNTITALTSFNKNKRNIAKAKLAGIAYAPIAVGTALGATALNGTADAIANN